MTLNASTLTVRGTIQTWEHVRVVTMEKLRQVAISGKIPPLSAHETREHLQYHVPEANDVELTEALYLMGFVEDGKRERIPALP